MKGENLYMEPKNKRHESLRSEFILVWENKLSPPGAPKQHLKSVEIMQVGGEVAEGLGTLTAPTDDPSLVPRAHTESQPSVTLDFTPILWLPCGLHAHGAHIYRHVKETCWAMVVTHP